MLTFRLTKRLAQRLGVRLDKTAPQSDGRLGDWFANIIDEPLPLVVCANAPTRLALAIPALDAAEVVFQFRMRLGHLLDALGVDDSAVAAELASTDPVAFAPTNDRRVVGSMNDICFHVAAGLVDCGGVVRERELFALERQLAGMPHVKLAGPFPERAVRAILGGADPSLHQRSFSPHGSERTAFVASKAAAG